MRVFFSLSPRFILAVARIDRSHLLYVSRTDDAVDMFRLCHNDFDIRHRTRVCL